MLRQLLLFVVLFFIVTSRAWSTPSFEVSLSQNEIRADQTAELKIQASWPTQEGAYSFGIPTPSLENLQLTNQAQSQETFSQNGQDWTRKTFTLELTPEKPGSGIIESFSITYINPSALDPAPGQFDIQTQSVKVIKLPYRMPSWLKLLLGGAVLLAIGGGGFALLRRRHQCAGMPNDCPKITFEEYCLGEAQKAGSIHDLSHVLRSYLGRVYPELEKKSELEIISALPSSKVSSYEAKDLQRILNELAEAKFTGQSSGDHIFRNLQKTVMTYIESKRVVGAPTA